MNPEDVEESSVQDISRLLSALWKLENLVFGDVLHIEVVCENSHVVVEGLVLFQDLTSLRVHGSGWSRGWRGRLWWSWLVLVTAG